jgi:hypothetical protein
VAYPRHDAVNDRPVKLVERADGCVDALVFDLLVGTLRTQIPVTWSATGNGECPCEAHIQAERWTIRVNDFPAEPLYTLLVDGRDQIDLEDWPAPWRKPV